MGTFVIQWYAKKWLGILKFSSNIDQSAIQDDKQIMSWILTHV